MGMYHHPRLHYFWRNKAFSPNQNPTIFAAYATLAKSGMQEEDRTTSP